MSATELSERNGPLCETDELNKSNARPGSESCEPPSKMQKKQATTATVRAEPLKEKLYDGRFGSVWKIPSTGHPKVYVVKIIKMTSAASKESAYSECVVHTMLSQKEEHPHLVRGLGMHLVKGVTGDEVRIITEYCPGGDMCNYAGLHYIEHNRCFVCQEAWPYMRQLLSAVQHLHQRGIAHLDIKPENLFLKDDQLKLGDNGCAVVGDAALCLTQKRGTTRSAAPEVVALQAGEHYNGFVADVWSIGVVAYWLLTLEFPDDEKPRVDEYHIFKRGGTPPKPFLETLDVCIATHVCSVGADTYKELVRRCMDYDVAQRCTAAQLLEHFAKK